MKTSQIALIYDVIEKIDELEELKLKLIAFIQEDEENYLERTDHICKCKGCENHDE